MKLETLFPAQLPQAMRIRLSNRNAIALDIAKYNHQTLRPEEVGAYVAGGKPR